MKLAETKKVIEGLFEEGLVDMNFARSNSMSWIRDSGYLVHGVHFFKHRDLIMGEVYLKYQNAEGLKPEEAMDCCERLGEWEFTRCDRVEFVEAICLAVNVAKKFIIRFETVEKIVSEIENGTVDQRYMFGKDEGWRRFNMGTLYLQVGKAKKGLELLSDVVTYHSAHPIEWVKRRKDLCNELIAAWSMGSQSNIREID